MWIIVDLFFSLFTYRMRRKEQRRLEDKAHWNWIQSLKAQQRSYEGESS